MGNVRSVVVSDLHLGTRSGADVLARGAAREPLLEVVHGADQVVLLGDTLELRDRPLADVVAAARDFVGALGEAAAGARVVLVAGNHDHQLAAPILEPRRLRHAGPLESEQLAAPGRSGPAAAVARALGRAELVVAYPGLWLRPDVYATHGHYLDCHMSIPTFEALAASLVQRLVGGMPEHDHRPDDYEAVLAPIYAFTFALAQAGRRAGPTAGGGASLKVWDRVNRASGRRLGLEAKLIGGLLVPGAAAALNRAGLGPFGSNLSATAIRRAGLEALREVVRRLGIDADHVVFGHTHRPGPIDGIDSIADWAGPDSARLTNCGSWVYEPRLVSDSPRSSAYWPGTCVVVDDEGPPQLLRLLLDVAGDQL